MEWHALILQLNERAGVTVTMVSDGVPKGQGSGRESPSRKQGTGEEAEPKVGGDILTWPWGESTVRVA